MCSFFLLILRRSPARTAPLLCTVRACHQCWRGWRSSPPRGLLPLSREKLRALPDRYAASDLQTCNLPLMSAKRESITSREGENRVQNQQSADRVYCRGIDGRTGKREQESLSARRHCLAVDCRGNCPNCLLERKLACQQGRRF